MTAHQVDDIALFIFTLWQQYRKVSDDMKTEEANKLKFAIEKILQSLDILFPPITTPSVRELVYNRTLRFINDTLEAKQLFP